MIFGLMEKKTFKLATLGCRTNQYETQAIRDQLVGLGYEEVEEGASLCIVNTCTVTEAADKSSSLKIRQMAKHNPGAKIVVTGCYSNNNNKLQEEIPEISQIVPNKDKEKLVSLLFPDENVPEFSIKNFDAHTRAFVKVQDGCNSFCSYCIIPYVRGRSKSRKTEEVLKEVEDLIAAGYQDIVITGINVGDFQDGEITLADLIRKVDKIKGLKRLRLSSIDPDEVNEDLMDAILNGQNTCPSLHLVLQSGSNVILKRMNRKYTRQVFIESVERLQKVSSDFTFTTDVIVGFPGETEKDFEETIDVMREVKFAKVHMFPFSARPRTKAFSFPNQLPLEVIQERKRALLKIAEEIAFDLRQRFVGQKMTVLTEDSGDFGHTENFLGVSLPSNQFRPNQIVEVLLKENTLEGFVGLPL